MYRSSDTFQRSTDYLAGAGSARTSFADYVMRKVAPLTRSLMGLAMMAFAAATLASTLQPTVSIILAVRLAPLAPMFAIALVAWRTHTRSTLVRLMLAYLLLLQIGMGLNIVGYSDTDWLLPGYMLLPISTAVVWPRLRDFLLGMSLCVLGPVPVLWMHVIRPDMRLQLVVYMGIALGLSVLLYTFITRILQTQYKLEMHLRDQKGIDDLTGVLMRQRFLDLTRSALVDAYNRRQPMSLIHLHADDFKRLNELQGSAAADRALVTLTDILRIELRSQDIIGRMGGHTFSVLLPGLVLAQAEIIAARLRLAMQALQRSGHVLTISVGVAEYTSTDGSMEALIQRADKALHQARHEQRRQASGPEAVFA